VFCDKRGLHRPAENRAAVAMAVQVLSIDLKPEHFQRSNEHFSREDAVFGRIFCGN